MYYSKNIRENINYIMDFISTINGDVLLDFNSKREIDYFLKYAENKNIFELGKMRKTVEEIPAKIILVTESGKIQKLSLLADKINKIYHYQISSSMTSLVEPLIIFKFQWILFKPSQLYSDFISYLQYVESFVKNYFDLTKSEKPLFLFSNGHDINRIKKDIEYLKDSTVLTARLAIFIYKICTWNFNISGTKVGKIFALNYKKSRIYNNKKFDIKNTKGYYIDTMQDYKIVKERIRIAEYLERHTNCSPDVISDATMIPIENLRR